MYGSKYRFFQQFHHTLRTFPETIEYKSMFGCYCAFANGYLFTGLDENEWFLRLSPQHLIQVLDTGAKPFAPMGRPFKDYIVIPKDVICGGLLLAKHPLTLEALVCLGLDFVCNLPAKKKKNKAKNQQLKFKL